MQLQHPCQSFRTHACRYEQKITNLSAQDKRHHADAGEFPKPKWSMQFKVTWCFFLHDFDDTNLQEVTNTKSMVAVLMLNKCPTKHFKTDRTSDCVCLCSLLGRVQSDSQSHSPVDAGPLKNSVQSIKSGLESAWSPTKLMIQDEMLGHQDEQGEEDSKLNSSTRHNVQRIMLP